MSYKNKTYVCLDYDEDKVYYNLMLAWKKNDHIDFDFNNAHELNSLRDGSNDETIKRKLRERMTNSKLAIVLVGELTKTKYKFVKFEMDVALEMEIPIIVVNLNKKKRIDKELCPPVLREQLVMHIPFGNSKGEKAKDIIKFTMDEWPSLHEKYWNDDKIEPRHWADSVYQGLGF